jgi:hypothetical protein
MKLHIFTQHKENYGAHDWDGAGQCPQYWKFKGGATYVLKLGDVSLADGLHDRLKAIVESVRPTIERNDDFFVEYILDWAIVADDELSEDEQLQMEFEGKIVYPDKVLTLPGVAATIVA